MRSIILLFCLSLSVMAEQSYLSPSDIVISHDGSVLYLACATDGSVQLFDTKEEKIIKRFDAEGVREIVLSPDSKRLYAVCGEFNGKLLEIDAKTGKTLRSFEAGHTPVAPVISTDGKTIFFCNRFSPK